MDAQDNREERLAGRFIGRLARSLTIAGGALLIGISILVSISVCLRSLTGSGIPGDFELVQIAAAIAAFCIFPLCQATRGNIIVDTFTARVPAAITRRIDALWNIVFGCIVAVLSWRLFVGAIEQFHNKTSLMVLELQTWWAVGLCALLAAVLMATAIAAGLRQWGGHHER